MKETGACLSWTLQHLLGQDYYSPSKDMQNSDFYQQLSSLGHESGLSSNSATEYKLRVEDLSPSVNKARLHDIFAPHGKLVRVTIFDDREWLKGLNYALVSFLYQADLLKAIKVCDGLYIDGSKIKVSAARAETNPNTANCTPCRFDTSTPPRDDFVVTDLLSAQYNVQSYATSFSSYSVYRAPRDQPRTSESSTLSSNLLTARNQDTVYETDREGYTHTGQSPRSSTQGNQGNVHVTRETLVVSQHSVASSTGTVRDGGSRPSIDGLATADSHAILNPYTPREIDAGKSVHFAAAPSEIPPWTDAFDDADYHQGTSSTDGDSTQNPYSAHGEAAVALFGSEEVADLTDQVLKTSDTPSFEGIYSFVYRGSYHGLSVAIKVLRAVSTKLRREMQTWWALNGHRNVLPLFGFHEDFGAFGAMISPWYRNGNSSDYLRTRWVPPAKRIALLLQVASVVAYLHAYDPQIIHGDLKPTNILIDDYGNARVCDFGLARLIAEYGDTGLTTTTAYTGTARYLSYELVESDETKMPTAASDVHALACVGFAFLYLDVPYAHRQGNQLTYIVRDIMKGVPPAKRPEGTTDPIIALLWYLLEACWALDPEERPSASTMAEFLIQYGKELEEALTMPF